MKRLRIGVAARALSSFGSGPSQYLSGLSQELIRQAADKHDLFFYYNTTRLLGSFPTVNERALPLENTLLWDHFALPNALRRDRIDLTLYPKGTIPFLSPGRKCPIMLDLGYFYPALNAYKLGNTLYMRQAMKFAARHAWLIFTISEATRQDVIRLLRVDPGITHNIYGGAAREFQRIEDPVVLQRVREKYGLQDPFIFFPASVSPRKNFPRVLQAFEAVQDQIPHHLYFTGHVGWSSQGLQEPLERLSERVHKLGLTTTEEMAAIYSMAQFAIYPSLFEGLGLPILEAFQCGVPLITSDQSSLPEVAGEAALIVDAYSIDSIAQGYLRLARDKELRQRLASAGTQRAKQFTWEKSVTTLLNAIEANWDK